MLQGHPLPTLLARDVLNKLSISLTLYFPVVFLDFYLPLSHLQITFLKNEAPSFRLVFR